MVTSDRTLICRDCGNEFIFTSGEQTFYAERGFVPPSRCASCRATRRAERQAMGNSDPRPSPPGATRPLFPAICAECGRETMVPFEPREGRAVYCRDCYNRQRERY